MLKNNVEVQNENTLCQRTLMGENFTTGAVIDGPASFV
jgi:hypothetical protein